MNCAQFQNKQIVICGMRGSGKTEFAKHIIKKCFKRHVVFDSLFQINPESFKKFRRWEVKHVEGGEPLKEEFGVFMDAIDLKKLDVVIIEEANRVAPSRESLPLAYRNIVDLGRQTGGGTSYISITRRPVQLHTDVLELADFLIIFALDGKNDIEYLNNIRNGLGDMVRDKVRAERHNFVIYRRGGEMSLFSKIKMEGSGG